MCVKTTRDKRRAEPSGLPKELRAAILPETNVEPSPVLDVTHHFIPAIGPKAKSLDTAAASGKGRIAVLFRDRPLHANKETGAAWQGIENS